MNERIQELAEQAVDTVARRRQLSDGQLERSWHPDHFNQAFAELLIAECGLALRPMLRDMISRGQAHELIKQHFGVDK
jgi:hypothetical protein